MRGSIIAVLFLVACGPGSQRGNGTVDAPGGSHGDAPGGGSGGSNQPLSYPVYAHSNTVLYTVDLVTKALTVVGPFNAPNSDVITDLAVAPDNTIYVISNTVIYTASATDGHVTKVGTLAACGTKGVALTTLPNGDIWTGDYSGALCKIDISSGTPVVGAPVTMGSGMALSGDLVAVDDGTVFGTAYKLSDSANTGTQASNVLVKIDLTNGSVQQMGQTGYPKLFGVAFGNGLVVGFTHDGTGHVVTIDTTSGTSTLFATYKDPSTNQPISFAGAGVSSLVQIIQ